MSDRALLSLASVVFVGGTLLLASATSMIPASTYRNTFNYAVSKLSSLKIPKTAGVDISPSAS